MWKGIRDENIGRTGYAREIGLNEYYIHGKIPIAPPMSSSLRHGMNAGVFTQSYTTRGYVGIELSMQMVGWIASAR
jgi:hypothetical protein